MATLKIFRGNWDGKRERAVVCATKKRAMELLGASASTMSNHFSQPSTRVREDDKEVWAAPDTVFQRMMKYGATRQVWRPVEPDYLIQEVKQSVSVSNIVRCGLSEINTMLDKKVDIPVGFDSWWERADRPETVLALIERDRSAFEAIWEAAQTALLQHQATVTLSADDGKCKRWCGDGECKDACVFNSQ